MATSTSGAQSSTQGLARANTTPDGPESSAVKNPALSHSSSAAAATATSSVPHATQASASRSKPTASAKADALASKSSSSSSTAAPGEEVTPTTIAQSLKSRKEWKKAVAFDHEGRLIAATVKPLEGEVEALRKLFDKREDTIASGIVLLNEQYDVHRFHPPLIYGRRGNPELEEGEGIAVCKVERKATSQPVYCLITYVYPNLSANMVPQLQNFCNNYLANLS